MTTNIYFLSPELRQDFVTLIAKQTGIEIREQNYISLGENIRSRVKTLNVNTPEAYYNLLSTPNSESEQEWQKFVCLMTNKESYFFRDKGQFILLRNHIFPEIIKNKQNVKNIRILSAGCSTGQEPYSLAILLRQMIPDVGGWTLNILGVDINQDAINQAQKGVYNAWSFRQVDDEIKEKYFKFVGSDYQLNQTVKGMVKFQRVNLAKDIFPNPNSDLRDMDLIICRNVFIYFTPSAINGVIEKFYYTLQDRGYLLTGHAELNASQISGFQVHLFPESVIYQKQDKFVRQPTVSHTAAAEAEPEKSVFERLELQLNKTVIKPGITPLSTQPKTFEKLFTEFKSKPEPVSLPKEEVKTDTSQGDLLKEAEELIQAKSYFMAGKKIDLVINSSPRNHRAYYLLAQINANLGKYDEAVKSCKKAIEIDSFSVAPLHLLVQISEEKGDLEEAKQLLKKIIYLEPCSVAAYLNLASLYQQEGDYKRADKMQQSALKILKGLPADTKVPELGNVTVKDLLMQLE